MLTEKEIFNRAELLLGADTMRALSEKRVILFGVGGVGTFSMRDMAARTGRNPQTGQPLPLPAHKKAGYRMSKTWKSKVNNRA